MADKVQKEVDAVKNQMRDNIDIILTNTVEMSDLSAKGASLRIDAKTFQKNATALHKQIWYRRFKLRIICTSITVTIMITLGIIYL